RLVLYPSGDKKRNGKGHISLYVTMVDTETLPSVWEVHVDLKLFVYDHKEDKYLTIQDANGSVCRFHEMETENGFAQLLPLDIFKDDFNGYLVDDCCAFGAEIFVIKGTCRMDSFPRAKEHVPYYTYTWEIKKFSALLLDSYDSKEFTAGGMKWKLRIYPQGHSTSSGLMISGFLALMDRQTLPLHSKVCAEYKLPIKNKDQSKHKEKKGNVIF
ncbi:MATH domain-containing protein, partial [Cephalotus follicularis]